MPERSQWSWTGLNTGLWAAVLAAIGMVWFVMAFAIWIGGLSAWPGVDSHAASCNPAGIMTWLIPRFLLAITFPILMTAIYLYLPADRRAPALVALMFATLNGTILGATYFVSGTLAWGALQSGAASVLEWSALGSPSSVLGTLEGAGYLFMGLSTLFAGVAWRMPGRWRRATRWLLVINGLGGVATVAVAILGYVPATMVPLGIWAASFPPAAILLAWRFKQDLRVAPPISRAIRT